LTVGIITMTDATHRSGFLERGGAWVLAQFVLLTAVILLGVMFHGNWTRVWLIAAGTGLFALGGGFGIAGVVVLGRNRTPFPQPRVNSELIQGGIYARVRHPLYTSVMLASLGWALIWQSWPALIVALVLIPYFVAKARREEGWLREKFPGYADYEKRVPRFLPRLLPPSFTK
jgi:protein-S-isoprenylcysteine O-methyltransferase Ste14